MSWTWSPTSPDYPSSYPSQSRHKAMTASTTSANMTPATRPAHFTTRSASASFRPPRTSAHLSSTPPSTIERGIRLPRRIKPCPIKDQA
ncbi:hypothetical protein ACFLXB_09885, partial [Chloroflexota bacterium]